MRSVYQTKMKSQLTKMQKWIKPEKMPFSVLNLRRASSLVLLVLLFAFSIFPNFAHAAAMVYDSVGQNTTDHKTGSPTVTIANGIATFSIPQTARNLAVGDKSHTATLPPLTFPAKSPKANGRLSRLSVAPSSPPPPRRLIPSRTLSPPSMPQSMEVAQVLKFSLAILLISRSPLVPMWC